MYPSSSDDTKDLQMGRLKVKELVSKWLQQD